MTSNTIPSFLPVLTGVKTPQSAKTVVTPKPLPIDRYKPPSLSQTESASESTIHRIKRKPLPPFLDTTFSTPNTSTDDFEIEDSMLFPLPDLRPPGTTPSPTSQFLSPSNITSLTSRFHISSGHGTIAGGPPSPWQDPRTRPRSFTSPELSSALELRNGLTRKTSATGRPQAAHGGAKSITASYPSQQRRLTAFIKGADQPVDDTLDDGMKVSPIRSLSPSAAKRGFLRIVIPRNRLSFDQSPLGAYNHHTSGALTCDSTLSFDFPLPPPVISFTDLGSSTSFAESTLDALSRLGMHSASELDLTIAPTSLRTSCMDSASFYTVPSTMSATPHGGELVLLKDRPLPSLPSLSSSQPEPAHIRFAHPAASDNIFKENRLPTAEQLELAARLTVTSEAGVQVPFYSLWKDQRTIVVFIRHFWCPMCQDYMFSISRSVSAQALRRAGVELVVISNGSYKMIPSYRKIFRTPFALYTDPTHAVYSAMGMTIQSLAKGPRPSYIKHGMAGGIAMVVGNAFKTGMPLFEDGGDISQLGGEFIMGPGLSCSFAHRMRYTRAHTSILTVVAEAGVDMVAHVEPERGAAGRAVLSMSEAEAASWMRSRRKQLQALASRRARRRGGDKYCDVQHTLSRTESDEDGSSQLPDSVCTESECSTPVDAATPEGLNPYSYLRSECSGAFVCSDSACSVSLHTSASVGASSLRSWMDRDSSLSAALPRSASNTTAGTIVDGDKDFT